IGSISPAGEEQHRKYVVHSLSPAHDIGPDGFRTVPVATVGDRLEHPQRALAVCVERARWPFVPLESTAQPLNALLGAQRMPAGVAEALRDHRTMRSSVLSNVQRREVKAESADTTDQAADLEVPGVPAFVLEQARGNDVQVIQELLRALVATCSAVVRCTQALQHLSQEHSIRHEVVPRT